VQSIYASDLEFTASVNRLEATLDDRIILMLKVSGAQDVSAPELPTLDGFQVFSSGSSSQVSIVNGKMKATVVFNYVMLPLKEGVLTIGPARLTYKGENYKTEPIEIKVVKDKKPLKKPNAPIHSNNQPLPPSDKDNQDNFFVELTVNKKEAYVNEQLVLSFKFYKRDETVGNIQYVPSETKDFLEESLGEEQSYREKRGESVYDVIELKRAIFPVKTGKLYISPASLKFNLLIRQERRRGSIFNDPFFDDAFFGGYVRKPVVLETNPIEIMVKPYPEENKPADFNGAVGEFNLNATVDPVTVKLGEPVTLKMVVNGEGNIKSITLPEIKEMDKFRNYEPEIKINRMDRDNKIYGEKIFEQVLVPKEPGKQEIREISFSYFNPYTAKYETLKQGPISIEVENVSEEEKNQNSAVEAVPLNQIEKKEITLYGRDINFIKEKAEDIKEKGDLLYKNVFFILLNSFPLGILIVFYFYKRRKDKFKTDVGYARLKIANKAFNKKLQQAKKAMNSGDGKNFYALLAKAMQEYLGNKLNIPAAGITSNVVEEELSHREVSSEILHFIKESFEACDMAKFALGNFSIEDMRNMLKKVENNFSLLDKKL